MNYDIKTEALLEMVNSFVSRGKMIQYDQYSLDRILKITPRRSEFLPPEAATEQKTVYLDCSSYVNALYYQTFGVSLESNLTWHMIDYVKPRIYYYELTHTETAEDIEEMEKEIRAILKPGDVITNELINGNGHTVMYIGDNKFTDCSPNGRPNSYDYENKKNREYESGGLWIQDASLLFEIIDDDCILRKSLFKKENKRFSISRPLDLMGNPTEAAMAKIGIAKGLVCGVEVSHFGGVHAAKGDKITYKVFVKNTDDISKDINVSFKEPFGTEFNGNRIINAKVSSGEKAEFEFSVEVLNTEMVTLQQPEVVVNMLKVYAPQVLLGKKLELTEIEKIVTDTESEILKGTKALFAATKRYKALNIRMTDDEQQFIHNCFYLHDSTKGDVLSRRNQKQEIDLAVYSMFGGIGVVTPEIAVVDGIRCNKIRKCDLLPGDIVLCADDSHGVNTYSSLYTGEKLVGVFEANGKITELTPEETDQFIDSLFGRFCFVVLRPQLYNQ